VSPDFRLLQDGAIRQLEMIGEATKNLSKNVRDMAPDVPWRDMAGMRDKLIHQYFGVDIEAVWTTAQEIWAVPLFFFVQSGRCACGSDYLSC